MNPSDNRRDAMSRMSKLPRKKERNASIGRCVACDADGSLYDDLCEGCFDASNDGLESKIEPAATAAKAGD